MKKRKNERKTNKALIVIIVVVLALVFGGTVVNLFRRCSKDDEPTGGGGTGSEWTDGETDGDEDFDDEGESVGVFLNEELEGATGAVMLTISGDDNTLEVATSEYTLLGSESVDSITIDGGDLSETTIRATGSGKTRIMANGNGTLTIKNATIVDETPHKGTYYWDYLSWGGKVVFENCAFKQSIKLLTTSATFKNCSFHSPWNKYYSVWVSDGESSFEGCTFTGTRALKIHEYEGEDITTVAIDNCSFLGLTEKPGLAIGTFVAAPANTTVSVKNSRFLSCHAWDNIGSIEGVHSFYETDTYTTDFVFINENNTVEYTANVYAINYYTIENGEAVAIPDYMWKSGGNYPTSYESGTGATIDDLISCYSVTSTEDLCFAGWYLDEAYTQKFEGVIGTSQTGDIKLYAKFTTASWTKNY